MNALPAEALAALRKTCGDDAVEVDAADGARLAPADAAALARGVAALSEHGIGARIEGGGTHAALGNPLRGAKLQLSTRRLAGVVELDAEEAVACVRAGTPLEQLRRAASDAGLELPFDPPGVHATVGGTLAAAALGPRHAGFGRPRDLVLGLEVVLGDGLRTRCGGRVVKNVTGYDLMKLHLGALGAFGVITSAWLRLRHAPECRRTLVCALAEADAHARALAVARLPTLRACALVDASLAIAVERSLAPTRGWLLVAELAGEEPAVARDVEDAASTSGARPTDVDAIGRVRALQGGSFGPASLRFRLNVLPSRLDRVSDLLWRAGGALLVYPASGLVYARFVLASAADGAGADAAWMGVRSAARDGGGEALLEAGPAWVKQGRDVFGEPRDGWRLSRALKARFDPAQVLNPGRFVGGI